MQIDIKKELINQGFAEGSDEFNKRYNFIINHFAYNASSEDREKLIREDYLKVVQVINANDYQNKKRMANRDYKERPLSASSHWTQMEIGRCFKMWSKSEEKNLLCKVIEILDFENSVKVIVKNTFANTNFSLVFANKERYFEWISTKQI